MRGEDAEEVSTVHSFRPFHCHSQCNFKPEVIDERTTACLCHGRSRYAYNNNDTFAAITETVALTQLLIGGNQLRKPVMVKGWVKVFPNYALYNNVCLYGFYINYFIPSF